MAFQAKYHFKKDNIVVLQHHLGGTIRADPNTNDAESDGKRGKWAQWELTLLGDDKIRLKNVGTGKCLRIKPGGDVDVGGGNGAATIFKVHTIEAPNVVKLESEKTGKYISVKKNGKVKKGGGGNLCLLTIYRNAGGGGGGGQKQKGAAQMYRAPQAEPEPESDSDYDNYDADKDKEEQDVKIPDPPKPLGEDAAAVKAWLETIGHADYVDTFIEAGYDKMGTVAMIDEADLEKMGVKPGHTKEIMLAAQAALFINHWVVFRSQHKKRYMAADDGNKKKVELDDKPSEKDAYWFVEQSPNGNNLIRLRSKYNSYLRIMGKIDNHLVTISKEKDIDGRCDLQILPCSDEKRQNVVRIWCPKNANFMTYDDNILKDRVNANEESFDKETLPKQQWEIIVKE